MVLLSGFHLIDFGTPLNRGQNTWHSIRDIGRERPQEGFGRLYEPKPGVAPAQAVCFVRGLLLCCLFGSGLVLPDFLARLG